MTERTISLNELRAFQPTEDQIKACIRIKEGMYFGVTSLGLPHGFGFLLMDGARYAGAFSYGKFTGRGTFISRECEYIGMWDNGVMHGQGHIIYKESIGRLLLRGVNAVLPLDTSNPLEYNGDFHREFHRHGQGSMKYRNGDVYKGTWSHNKRSDQGELITARGARYVGPWRDDVRHGQAARMQFADGTIYEGEYREDQMSGRGIQRSPNGSIYEGNFERDAPNGNGSMTYHNGDVYEGEWRNGLRHGSGEFRLASTGAVIRGRFRKGLANGEVSLEEPNGKLFIGFFINGRRSVGTQWDPDGAVYRGQWESDMYNGQGEAWLIDPETKESLFFSGSWASGERTGQAIVLHPSGMTVCGYFVEGKPKGLAAVQFSDSSLLVIGRWSSESNLQSGFVGACKFDENRKDGSLLSGLVHCFDGEGAVYAGQIKEGKRDGFGIHLVWSGDKKPSTISSLDIDTQKPNASLLLDLCNADVDRITEASYCYVGKWVSGLPHGEKGVLRYPSGAIYKGTFSYGHRAGQGMAVSANQRQLLTCGWIYGLPNGPGTLSILMESDEETTNDNETLEDSQTTSSVVVKQNIQGSWRDGLLYGPVHVFSILSDGNSLIYSSDFIAHAPRTAVPTKREKARTSFSITKANSSSLPPATAGSSFFQVFRPPGECFLCHVTFPKSSLQSYRLPHEDPSDFRKASKANTSGQTTLVDICEECAALTTRSPFRATVWQQVPNGCRSYDGYFADGLPHGFGTLWDEEGTCYIGSFHQNVPHGAGILLFTNGDVYDGGFDEKGAMSGSGVYRYQSGRMIEGIWAEGNLERILYHGDSKNEHGHGEREGIGIERCENGEVFEGEWMHGLRHGKGVFRSAEKSLYTGEFKKGVRSGRGKEVWPDGQMYIGEFAHDKPHGQGVLITHTQTFKGCFVEGKREGVVTIVHSSTSDSDQLNLIQMQLFANGQPRTDLHVQATFGLKSSEPNCAKCTVAFGLTTWRHTCRACGLRFCEKCSAHRIVLPSHFTTDRGTGIKNPQRVCDTCFALLSEPRTLGITRFPSGLIHVGCLRSNNGEVVGRGLFILPNRDNSDLTGRIVESEGCEDIFTELNDEASHQLKETSEPPHSPSLKSPKFPPSDFVLWWNTLLEKLGVESDVLPCGIPDFDLLDMTPSQSLDMIIPTMSGSTLCRSPSPTSLEASPVEDTAKSTLLTMPRPPTQPVPNKETTEHGDNVGDHTLFNRPSFSKSPHQLVSQLTESIPSDVPLAPFARFRPSPCPPRGEGISKQWQPTVPSASINIAVEYSVEELVLELDKPDFPLSPSLPFVAHTLPALPQPMAHLKDTALTPLTEEKCESLSSLS